jgi:outer membrane protein assembly factor BamD
MRPAAIRWGLVACLLGALLLAGCETARPKVKVPARLLFLEGQAQEDKELWSDAITKFQAVVEQNPGTQLASFAFLKLAEVYAMQGKWPEAETNYRLFLTTNVNSHLTPYVLYRLVRAHHSNSFSGLFFPSREIDRDTEPNRQIIQEYKRFFFLYPKSIYLEEIRTYHREAEQSLAEHEQMVADFYFRRAQYNAAASRYLYLLRTYPSYRGARGVLERLIESYRRNQQPDLAGEMERLYRLGFGATARGPDGSDGSGGAGDATTSVPTGPAPLAREP